MRALHRAQRIEPSIALLVAGLALACFLQGAFYPKAQVLVAVPLVVGAFLAPRRLMFTRPDLPIVVVAAVLAGWAVLDGALTGHVAAGLRYLLLIAGVLAVVGVCRQLTRSARVTLVQGLIWVCCVVAAFGWLGVVAFHALWGLHSDFLWRASSTLTYPNATAAVLAMAALVCLAVRCDAPTARWSGGTATVLLVGLAATLSRAGLGGLAIGLVLLGVGIGWRPLLRAAVGPLLGTLVAVVGLLPAIAVGPPTVLTVGIAAVGAVLGCAIGCYVRANRIVLVLLGAGLVGALIAAAGPLAARFTLDSPDRWGSFQAAWQLFLGHPVDGVGPGIDQLVLPRAAGGVSVYGFVHNEYLQVLAELGVLGAIALIAFLVLVLRRLWRDRAATGVLGIGGLAAFAALLVHAGFDFVWHIPAVPLLGAVFVGVAMRDPDSSNTEPEGSDLSA